MMGCGLTRRPKSTWKAKTSHRRSSRPPRGCLSVVGDLRFISRLLARWPGRLLGIHGAWTTQRVHLKACEGSWPHVLGHLRDPRVLSQALLTGVQSLLRGDGVEALRRRLSDGRLLVKGQLVEEVWW